MHYVFFNELFRIFVLHINMFVNIAIDILASYPKLLVVYALCVLLLWIPCGAIWLATKQYDKHLCRDTYKMSNCIYRATIFVLEFLCIYLTLSSVSIGDHIFIAKLDLLVINIILLELCKIINHIIAKKTITIRTLIYVISCILIHNQLEISPNLLIIAFLFINYFCEYIRNIFLIFSLDHTIMFIVKPFLLLLAFYCFPVNSKMLIIPYLVWFATFADALLRMRII